MKQKIKRILFKLFTLGILLISISCEKEEYDIKKENNKVRIKEVKFENLLKEPKFKNLIENFSRNSISNRTAFENQYGFTIVNNNVKIIETDLTTSYTMLIERDENINNSSFENLVIQEDIYNNQKAAIIKYNPTEILNSIDDSFRFTGSIEKTNIVNFTGFNRNKSTNTSQSDPDCYIELTVCNNDGYDGIGPEHIASAACKRTYIKRYKVLCGGGSGDGNGGGGDGDTGGNDYGSDDDFWSGGGDGGANDFDNSGGESDGDPTITPTPEEEEPELITSPIPSIDGPKTPCTELLKMTNNYMVKNALDGLKDFTNLDYEKGFKVKKGSNNILNALPLVPSDLFPDQVKMEKGKDIIGAFHTHPEDIHGYVTMFSDGDIKALYDIIIGDIQQGGSQKDISEYFLTLTVPEGTFALKIKDKTKFRNFMLSDKWDKSGNLEMLRNLYNLREPIADIIGFQNDLLSILKESGIGLYEANNSLSSWSELSINENNPDGIPNKTNCN